MEHYLKRLSMEVRTIKFLNGSKCLFRVLKLNEAEALALTCCIALKSARYNMAKVLHELMKRLLRYRTVKVAYEEVCLRVQIASFCLFG